MDQKKPFVLTPKTGGLLAVDVDDTLVLWNVPNDYEGETIVVEAHNSFPAIQGVIRRRLAVNTAVIKKIKTHKQHGWGVVVWSQGGWEWAQAVVEQLGLSEYVDVIMDKPTKVFDDLAPAAWMPFPERVFPKGWQLFSGGAYYQKRHKLDEGEPVFSKPKDNEEEE